MIKQLELYQKHYQATVGWLLRSVDPKTNGSRAYYSPFRGWAAPYPETTGYIIPTLLQAAQTLSEQECQVAAEKMGVWLRSIQLESGAWPRSMYTSRTDLSPSVFNTGQIILGMLALYRQSDDSVWLNSAVRAAQWLQSTLDMDGTWPTGNHRGTYNPSYYTRVAWPMLEVAAVTGDEKILAGARAVLSYHLSHCNAVHAFENWSFWPGKPAFTHTIAYTVRGLLESAVVLDEWDAMAESVLKTLGILQRKAELANGRLAGSYDSSWKAAKGYTCLTGNAQTAICLLRWEQQENDLRLVNTAAKLLDCVCAKQSLGHPVRPIRGAVAGSAPFWGRYMFLRYPNWAAKFHCDALALLIRRLNKETDKPAI